MPASASLQWPGLTVEPCAFQVKSAFSKNPHMPFSWTHLFSHFFEFTSVYSNTLLSENWVIKNILLNCERENFSHLSFMSLYEEYNFSLVKCLTPYLPLCIQTTCPHTYTHLTKKKIKKKVTSQVLWVQNNTILIIKSTLYSIPFHISRQVEKNNLFVFCTP